MKEQNENERLPVASRNGIRKHWIINSSTTFIIMSSASSWTKVAAGARLVLEAVAKQTAEEASVAAQRATSHGLELGSRARQAAAASQDMFMKNMNGNTRNSAFRQDPQRNNPYESQMRKQQDDEPQPIHGNSVHTTSSIPNPYLLHAEQPNASSIKADDSETSSTEVAEKIQESSPLHDAMMSGENQIRPSADGRQEMAQLREGQAVPSSRFGRAAGFASLGFGLAFGTASEFASRLVSSSGNRGSAMASDANADRLAATLCRMRGAALKMGQMLSIQDESLLPPALTRALKQVRQGADAMPHRQLAQQLTSELGPDWRSKFESFEDLPFAAASIGQVHRATIHDETTGQVKDVVVKVQYPGVANSIESDLRNLSMLVTMTGLAPRGLFLENVIEVGRNELKVECDYINEMANQRAFQKLVASDSVLQENNFVVPGVVEALTTGQVIVSEFAPGGTIDKVSHLDQEERNRIGRTILYLTMQELFDWRLMQTDPNWGNFLYDVGTKTTSLIDFGATREYDKEFVDGYLRIVWANANQDEETLMEQSRRMHFLTGEENEEMLNAHKWSGFTVGEPFWKNEPFDFEASQISTRMSEHTSVFLKHRLT
jgi:aarF domain-containing kinase